jgi:hypothetical protein
MMILICFDSLRREMELDRGMRRDMGLTNINQRNGQTEARLFCTMD